MDKIVTLPAGTEFMEDRGSVHNKGGASVGFEAAFGPTVDQHIKQVIGDTESVEDETARVYSQRNAKFSATPSHPDQLIALPETVRPQASEIAIFYLGESDNEKALNDYHALMNRALPAGSPEIIVEEEKTEFNNGTWCILVRYRKLLYQKL